MIVQTNGNFPARHGHGMEKVEFHDETSLVVFWGGNMGLINDFYHASTNKIQSKSSLSWNQVFPSIEPGIVPKAGFASCSHGHLIYIFGGIQEDLEQDSMNNDLLEYNTLTNKIRKLASYAELPAKRMGSSIVHVGKGIDSYLLLFGGMNEQYKPMNDFWKFRVKDSRWEKVSLRWGKITARESHTAVYYKQDDREYVIIYGGFCIRDNHVERLKEVIYFDLNGQFNAN